MGLEAAGGWIIRIERAQLVWREIARWQQKVAHLASRYRLRKGLGRENEGRTSVYPPIAITGSFRGKDDRNRIKCVYGRQ